MFCRNCGSPLNENAAFCPECGTPTGLQQTDSRRPEEPFHYDSNGEERSYRHESGRSDESYQYESRRVNEPYQYVPQEPERPATDGYAIASLILGILGFFILPIIGGILAIVFGNKSIRENGMNTMARVGKILGIICLVLSIIAIVIIVAAVVLFGVGSMMDMYM